MRTGSTAFSELRRRLNGRAEAEPGPPVPTDDTRRLLERLWAIRSRPAPAARGPLPAERLGGVEAAPGLIRIVRRYPLSLRHGRLTLSELTRVEADRHGALRWRGRLLPERLIFLDTETTGLAGGAGTLAFLVGVARLADDALELTQWLLTAFSGEAALLDHLMAAMAAEDLLVSFNGKAFDLPLLETRARLLGRAGGLRRRPHIDLLYALRRAHGDSLPDCRLQTAETHLLGLERGDDLPGALAPAAWRAWLARGEAGGLGEVLTHNRNDLLSTVLLLAVLAQGESEFALECGPAPLRERAIGGSRRDGSLAQRPESRNGSGRG